MNATLPLFKQPDGAQKERAPLADKLRPQGWDDFIAGPGLDRNLLRQLRQGRGRAPSLILWGPPGSGKTTLARLIGRSFACRFIEVSSVLAGVKEIREVAGEAALRKDPTILFIDEIHRLNKGQQDSFLPHVENGTFVLIGATTENPSFYLTSALLSRTRVVVLEPLSDGDMMILARRGAAVLGLELEDAGLQILTGKASRDARRLFNMLESLAGALSSKKKITREQIANFLESAGELIYDRAGEEHYNMASAFIKSMRGSNPDAALYWCFRMIEAGEDPRFLIRRMMIFASEDIGNAEPQALPLAVATAEAFDRLGLPEGRIPIAQCVTFLASAPKSNRSYVAMHRAIEAIKEHSKVTVPLHLRNAPTGLMKSLGYGAEYQYPHDYEGAKVSGVRYLPEELGEARFYEPSDRGGEKAIGERLSGKR